MTGIADIILNLVIFLATMALILIMPCKDGKWMPDRLKKAF